MHKCTSMHRLVNFTALYQPGDQRAHYHGICCSLTQYMAAGHVLCSCAEPVRYTCLEACSLYPWERIEARHRAAGSLTAPTCVMYQLSAPRHTATASRGGFRSGVVVRAASPDVKSGVATQAPDDPAPQRLRALDELPCMLLSSLGSCLRVNLHSWLSM